MNSQEQTTIINEKRFMKTMKKIVNNEIQFRRVPQYKYDVWSERLGLIRSLGFSMAGSFMITNAGGVMGNHKTMKQLLNEADLNTIEEVEEAVDSTKVTLSYSKTKQKFFTHAHNINLNECRRYHLKLQALEAATMEKLQDGDGAISIDGSLNGEGHNEMAADGAFLEYCNEALRSFNLRKKIIDIDLPKLILKNN